MNKLFYFGLSVLALIILPTRVFAGIGSWEVVGELRYARYAHVMAPLNDGSVLMAGGFVNSSLFTDGAMLNGNSTNRVERYWPDGDSITEEPPMRYDRAEACHVVLPDGDVVIFGGARHGSNAASNVVERYDVETRTWTTMPEMIGLRRRHSACMLNDHEVLIAGGSTGRGALMSAEIYNVETGVSTAVSDLPQPVKEGTLVMLDGIPTYMGGRSGGVNSARQQSIFVYHRQYDSWISRMVESTLPSSASIVQRHDGSMLMSGGIYEEKPLLLESAIWRMIGTRLTVIGEMFEARVLHTSTSVGEHTAIISGGYDETLTALRSCDFVNLTESTVRRLPNLNVPRAYHQIHVFEHPELGLCAYAIGGATNGPRLTKAIERLVLLDEPGVIRSLEDDPFLEQASDNAPDIVEVEKEEEDEEEVVVDQDGDDDQESETSGEEDEATSASNSDTDEFASAQPAYPNPTHTTTTITADPVTYVRVLDANGIRLSRHVSGTNTVLLDFSHHPRGVYIIEKTLNGQRVTEKIIKH